MAAVLCAGLFPAAGFGAVPGGPSADDGDALADDTHRSDADSSPHPGEVTGGTDDATDDTDDTDDAASDSDASRQETDASDGSALSPVLAPVQAVVTILFVVGLILGLATIGASILDVDVGSIAPIAWLVTALDRPVAGLASATDGLRAAIGTVPGTVLAAVLAVSGVVDRTAGEVARAVGDVATELRRSLSGVGGVAGRAMAAVAAAMAAIVAVPRALSIGLSVSALLAEVTGGSGGDTPERDAREDDGADRTRSLSGIDAVWVRFEDRAPVDDADSATPGEIARRAVDAGLPSEPVRRVTRSFREVSYGGREADEDRLAAARSALDDLGGDDE
ncbi:hypothetical protein BRD17_00555 [Halobacteriales archaeon SW_7_68_16]|nr:MAG: hypothetical protein BRD17_00555 [Halobacteriales archaeon SW_7_68_16]